MSSNTQELSFKKFIDEIHTTGSYKISLLCGNGLHNALTKNDLFKLTNDDYKKILNQVCQDIKDILKQKKNIHSPEEFFGQLRVLYGMKIFDKFQSDQCNFPTGISLNNFLKQFKSIYTLNYDVLIYRSFFNQNNDSSDLVDGFFGGNEILIDVIKNRLSNDNHRPCYFLHGAFHLLYNWKNKSYTKIIRNNQNDNLAEIIQETYERLLNNFRKGIVELDPLIVFASRSEYKSGAIYSDEYLRFCLEELEKECSVFTFGCSFKNDQHILDILLKGKNKKLYFGFYNDDDKERIKDYISFSNSSTSHKIVYINLKKDSKDIQKILKNGF